MTYPDSLLYQVTKPARYTGGEWNSMAKDWEKTRIKFALSYPDVYEIGMSNMALPILYDLLNRQADVLAERVFAPWVDMAAMLRSREIPLASLETKHPLKEFDIIGFSLGYELTYTNVLNMLHLAQIPVLAKEREDAHPLVIAGGTCALNPEPMADFIDLFVIGDGEEVLLELLDCFRDWKGKSASKQQLLLQLANISGIYIPSLYRVEYQADGLFKSISPTVPTAKPVIQRRIVSQLPPPVTKPVVPYIEVVHDRGAIEIQRGCSRGCRFCQAGIIYRPVRERPQAEVLQGIGDIIVNCGYNNISLVSLCTNDYPGIDQLVADIMQHYAEHSLTLSLPSLRTDSSSVRLVASLPSHRKTGLTFAPEAGSQRLRQSINKGISEDEILQTAATAFAKGWNSLKLYFMLGLPTETRDDVQEIVYLIDKMHSLSRKETGRRPQIRVSVSTFVPKPHTPFQWVAQANQAELDAKHELLQHGLRRTRSHLSWPEFTVSLLEAVLSRGDRRLGQVIHRAWQLGSTFDAWDEHFHYDNWQRAFAEAGFDPEFYTQRDRSLDEPLPWAHIDVGVSTAFLKQEYQRALAGRVTPDCRTEVCNACGLEYQPGQCQQRRQQLS